MSWLSPTMVAALTHRGRDTVYKWMRYGLPVDEDYLEELFDDPTLDDWIENGVLFKVQGRSRLALDCTEFEGRQFIHLDDLQQFCLAFSKNKQKITIDPKKARELRLKIQPHSKDET